MSSRLEEVEGQRRSRRARREHRQRTRRRALVALAVAIAVAIATWSVTRYAANRPADAPDLSPQAQSTSTMETAAPQDTLLLVRYDESEQVAESLTLLAPPSLDERALVLFIPVGTLVEIPGYGLERLGRAYQFGGAALVEASVESLLGIAVDHTAAASSESLAVFLDRMGGVELDVPEELVQRSDDGSAEVRFKPGVQFLDGARLVELWGFTERDESELVSFANQQLVWEAVLTVAADPAVVDEMVGDGAPQLSTDADAEALRAMLTGLAHAQADGDVTYTTLPVEPFGDADDGATYRTKEDDVDELITTSLTGSVPRGGGADAVEIQILNGVGTPGIGAAVDRALEGGGFRTVLTDNARSFDYDRTLILVYAEDEASLAAAERVRQRLGVGTIQVSRQPQSLVDLTIVVGADFEPSSSTRDAATEPQEQPS